MFTRGTMTDILEKLIRGLASENTDGRFYSAKALRTSPDERAFNALQATLENEKNDEIRNEIGEALVSIADEVYRRSRVSPSQ
jgi:HEAT repeat protein